MARKTGKKENAATQPGRVTKIEQKAAARPEVPTSPALAVTAKTAATSAILPMKAAVSEAASKAVQCCQNTMAEPASPKVLPAPVGQPPQLAAQRQAPTKSLPEAVHPVASTRTMVAGVKVPFILLHPDARRVSLSGEFNGWSPDKIAMRRHEDGRWEATIELAPGRYEYKFVVDGQWLPDPRAHENVPNQHGTLNSVVVVRA